MIVWVSWAIKSTGKTADKIVLDLKEYLKRKTRDTQGNRARS